MKCCLRVVEVNVLWCMKTLSYIILGHRSGSHPPAGLCPSLSQQQLTILEILTLFFSWALGGCTLCSSGSESTRSEQETAPPHSMPVEASLGKSLISPSWHRWVALRSGSTISSSDVLKPCRDSTCSVQTHTPGDFYWIIFLVSLTKPIGIFMEMAAELAWTIYTKWKVSAS